MQTSNLPPFVGSRPSTPSAVSSDRSRRIVHSAEQTLFLQRFQTLLSKRQQHVGNLRPDDWRMRLIDKALYSTYLDCLQLDVRDEVREILRRCRAEKSV
jgi:hypothetical protein